MTEPLYQRDAYLAAFDAQVIGVEPDGIVLDRTAFFLVADHGDRTRAQVIARAADLILTA